MAAFFFMHTTYATTHHRIERAGHCTSHDIARCTRWFDHSRHVVTAIPPSTGTTCQLVLQPLHFCCRLCRGIGARDTRRIGPFEIQVAASSRAHQRLWRFASRSIGNLSRNNVKARCAHVRRLALSASAAVTSGAHRTTATPSTQYAWARHSIASSSQGARSETLHTQKRRQIH